MTSKTILSRVSVAAIGAALIGTLPAAHAQVSEEDQIVVTARKQAETLVEAPVSVAAFGEDQIENLGMRDINDVARHTAGFSFSQAFGRTTERPVIRGAANILAGVQFGVESGTAYFIDGVYYNGDMASIDLRNIERVEVIKGAQSALYGRNTYAGAVNFITRKPGADGFAVAGEVLAAQDDEYEVYARVENSLGDGRLGWALSARHYEYGGDRDWINADGGAQLGDESSFNLNLTVAGDLSDKLSVMARVGYTEDDDGPRPFRLIGAEQNNCYPGYRSGGNYSRNPFPFPTPFGGIFNGVTTPEDNSDFQYFCGDLSQFEDLAPAQTLDAGPFFGVSREMIHGLVKADYEFDNGLSLTGDIGFRNETLRTGADSNHLEGETGPGPGGEPYVFPISPFFSIGQQDGVFYNAGENETDDISAELILSSASDKAFRWSIGAFAYDFEQDIASLSLGNVGNPLGPVVDTLTIENSAIFGTVDYDVTDQLTFSFEGRFQEETKGRLERDTGYESTVTYDSFLPKFIASYDINDDSSAYASFALGEKPGGINGTIGVPTGDEFYAPEESKNWEAGYKTRFMENRGLLATSVYFNELEQYQLTTPVAVAGSTAINSVATNQGSAEVFGVELEGSFDVTDNLKVGGSYTYMNAEFTKGCDDFEFTLNTGGFLIAPFDRTNPPETGLIRNPAGGAGLLTPPTDPQGFFTGDLSCSIAGNKIPMTSENQFSLYGQYEAALTGDWSWYANADYTYEGSKFIQVHNGMETGETGILGGNIGVKNDAYKAELFVRNALNERTPPIATRWFDLQEGFTTLPSSVGGYIDRSVIGPRSAFLSYRRGSQVGVRLSADF